jgi:hypothetical protein
MAQEVQAQKAEPRATIESGGPDGERLGAAFEMAEEGFFFSEEKKQKTFISLSR